MLCRCKMTDLPRLCTVSEVAAVLRVSNGRVYDLVRCGHLPSVRLGRQVRIPADRFTDWLDGGGVTLPGGWRREAP
jgi:excisionase family DNA binding protein